MSNNDRPTQTTIERQAFWSARTLRVDTTELEGGEIVALPASEDVLGVDRDRCIFAYGDWGELIVRLLNEHFAKYQEQTDA